MTMRPSIHFTFEVHTGDGTDVDVEIDMIRGPVIYQQGLAPAFSQEPAEVSIDSAGSLVASDVKLSRGVLTLTLRRPPPRTYLAEIERDADGMIVLGPNGLPVGRVVTEPEPPTPLPPDCYITITGRVRF